MRTRSKYFVFAVLVALLLHVCLLDILWNLPKAHPIFKDISEPQKIQVHLNQDTRPQKQLVQIKPPKEDRIPRKADYVSEFNSSVAKETQAKNKSPDSKPRLRPLATLPKGPGPKRNLLPTWQDLEQMQPQTDFNDHIETAETSAKTELNTFEWKHAAYLNRVKESVAHIWSPQSQIRRYDPAGALIGNQLRMTILEVTVDHSGKVIESRVKQSSGVFYLDDEALRAFREAGFFPNPPEALFDENNESYSFNFGFAISPQKGFSLSFD